MSVQLDFYYSNKEFEYDFEEKFYEVDSDNCCKLRFLGNDFFDFLVENGFKITKTKLSKFIENYQDEYKEDYKNENDSYYSEWFNNRKKFISNLLKKMNVKYIYVVIL